MKVTLLARPQFLGLPTELGEPREDQLKGADAEKLIETAGRVCYDSFGHGRDSADYAKHIMEVGHGSVCEHAQYSFLISGISRGCSHEWVRHRIGCSASQRSTRYVSEDASPWINHPLLDRFLNEEIVGRITDPDHLMVTTLVNAAVDAGRDAYKAVVQVLQDRLGKQGVDTLTARKQARGAARGFLGNALETQMVWSANVRAIRGVLEQRASPAADAEIRAVAFAIWDIMRVELPAYFADYQPVECPDALPGGLKSKYGRV